MTRPVPVPDEQSAPYWTAAADRVLTLARCRRCATLTLPPDVACPQCHCTDPDFEFSPIDGSGVIRSWTVVRQSFLAVDLPFILVDVEINAQPQVRLIGRLLDGVDAPAAIGAAVVTAFEEFGDGILVPAFELVR